MKCPASKNSICIIRGRAAAKVPASRRVTNGVKIDQIGVKIGQLYNNAAPAAR
jgi:hypothetical protein